MRFIGSVIDKLQRHPKRIVFPEGHEPRARPADLGVGVHHVEVVEGAGVDPAGGELILECGNSRPP